MLLCQRAILALPRLLQKSSNTADQLRSGAPVRLADGGTGRHLSSQYGCRPELRQLHPLVRQHRAYSRAAVRTVMSNVQRALKFGNMGVLARSSACIKPTSRPGDDFMMRTPPTSSDDGAG